MLHLHVHGVTGSFSELEQLCSGCVAVMTVGVAIGITELLSLVGVVHAIGHRTYLLVACYIAAALVVSSSTTSASYRVSYMAGPDESLASLSLCILQRCLCSTLDRLGSSAN